MRGELSLKDKESQSSDDLMNKWSFSIFWQHEYSNKLICK